MTFVTTTSTDCMWPTRRRRPHLDRNRDRFTTRRRARARQLAIGLLVSIGLVGCGDDPGYQLLVVNRSAEAVIIVAEGDTHNPRSDTFRENPAFRADASAVVLTPVIRAGLHANGALDTQVTVFGSACRRLDSLEVGTGMVVLEVGAAAVVTAHGLSSSDPSPGATTPPEESQCGPP